MPRSDRGRGRRTAAPPSSLPYAVVGVLLLAGVAVAWFALREPGEGLRGDPFHLASAPGVGNPDANVTLVAFESPNCPSCRLFHHGFGDGTPSTYDRIVSAFVSSGKVRYVEKTFFIGEPWEVRGASAQRCVWYTDPGRFMNLTHAFYRSQSSITEGNLDDFLRSWAQAEGVDGESLVGCANANPHGAEIRQDVADGRAAGVRGTPTYFVVAGDRTKTIVGPQPYATFERAIQDALGG